MLSTFSTAPYRFKKGKFLYSAASSPKDRSKRFTFYFPDRPVHSDTISASLGSIRLVSHGSYLSYNYTWQYCHSKKHVAFVYNIKLVWLTPHVHSCATDIKLFVWHVPKIMAHVPSLEPCQPILYQVSSCRRCDRRRLLTVRRCLSTEAPTWRTLAHVPCSASSHSACPCRAELDNGCRSSSRTSRSRSCRSIHINYQISNILPNVCKFEELLMKCRFQLNCIKIWNNYLYYILYCHQWALF